MKPDTRSTPLQHADRLSRGVRVHVLKVVLVYAGMASLWILGSDWLLGQLVSDPSLMARIGAFKGWFFVVVTSLILYRTLRHIVASAAADVAAGSASSDRATMARWPSLSLLLGIGAVAAVTLVAARTEYLWRLELQTSQIEAVAQLPKSQQRRG